VRASTTLSSASSEIDEGLEIAKPKRGKIVLSFIGAGAVAAGIYFLFINGKAPPPAPPPVATTTTVTPPAPPQPPPVPVKKTVTIRFEAEPAGAHVFRKKDDKDLGVVPIEIQLGKDAAKAGPDALSYVLKLPGYKERPLTADVNMDRTFHVSLEKAAAPVDPRDKKGKPAGGGHHVTKKNKNPVDEDGLATPSF
jgi:hypothetical protein